MQRILKLKISIYKFYESEIFEIGSWSGLFKSLLVLALCLRGGDLVSTRGDSEIGVLALPQLRDFNSCLKKVGNRHR